MNDLDFFTPGARLALELECLLLDTRNDAVQSRWWDSAHEALEQWRQAVRAMEAADAAPQQPAATSETVDVIGTPEFDGLLDHIYEHGTAAEGVIEKANAFARAVIARYAPHQPQDSTTLEEAASHARVCSGLAEQYKSDPVLFAAPTDAAAIIRDLMRDRLGASATGAGQAEIEARDTLDSERAANSRLTEELAASREREARMRGAAMLLRGRLLLENPNAVTDDADAALAEGAQG